MIQHHAFVIEAGDEEGIAIAEAWAKKELPSFAKGYGGHSGMQTHPDLVVLRYGLLSVEDARKIADVASGKPFAGEHKVVIIAANRAYHEAQNALLKLFEEPPSGTFLFLIMPSLGGLLPTLRSRVQVLTQGAVSSSSKQKIPEIAEQFLKASKEKRSAMIKKLTSGKDEEERRENREEAITILNGVEQAAYMSERRTSRHRELLEDIQELRVHLYDRSAPVKMILEHISLVIPKGLI